MVIKLATRSSTWLTRLLGRFMDKDTWITIWDTIYYPDHVDSSDVLFTGLREHEKVHVKQWYKYGWLFPILYYLIPFPIFFSYFRWKFEREAYLVDMKYYSYSIEYVVDKLGSKMYLWPWPKSLMSKWFHKNTQC